MKLNKELSFFLKPYSKETQELALDLRTFITEKIPEANELIWDNYNAVAIAYSKSEKLKDAFCHISIYPKHINFGFNRGTELTKSSIELVGKGKLIRHIKVVDLNEFPRASVGDLIMEAVEISERLNIDIQKKTSKGKSIVMSISHNKRRPK